MVNRTLSTALQDKATTHNRLGNTSRQRDPLNRLGHVIAGSPGTRTASQAPLGIYGSRQTQTEEFYFNFMASIAT